MNKWLIGLIVLLVLVLVGFSVRFLSVQTSEQKEGAPDNDSLATSLTTDKIESAEYTYSFPELGMEFSYPSTWGQPGSSLKIENSLDCGYAARFPHNQYIGMCAYSHEQIDKCNAEPACESAMPQAEWNQDIKELQSIPVGGTCSHSSVRECTVVQLTKQTKALSFFGSRPDSKTYLFYHNGYFIAFSFDFYDFCTDSQPRYVNDCVNSMENNTAKPEISTSVEAFEKVVKSVHLQTAE
jgi:hypothetical protein